MKVSAKMNKDVVLPSQEGKQGVMQYALYVVYYLKKSMEYLLTITGRLLTKLPTGLVKDPSGHSLSVWPAAPSR